MYYEKKEVYKGEKLHDRFDTYKKFPSSHIKEVAFQKFLVCRSR